MYLVWMTLVSCFAFFFSSSLSHPPCSYSTLIREGTYWLVGPILYTAVSKVKVNSSPAFMLRVSVPLLTWPPTLQRRSVDARSVTGPFWSHAGLELRRMYFQTGNLVEPAENCWKM